MPRKPNASIGFVYCPICCELGAVRKDKRGRFYYVSRAGTIGGTPWLANWIAEHARIWGEGDPDPSAPDWIVKGRAAPPEDPQPLPAPPAPPARQPGESDPPAPPAPDLPQPRSSSGLDWLFKK